MSSTSQTQFTPPPLDGSVSFGQLVDFHLEHNPTWDYAVLAPATGTTSGPIHLTYAELTKAVHRGSHIINPVNGGVPTLGTGNVIAIFASTDTLLYQTMVLAVARSGNVPLPISNRNTSAAVVNLLEKTSCHHVIYSATPAISHIAQESRRLLDAKSYDLAAIPLPKLEDIFVNLGNDGVQSDAQFTPYPKIEHPKADSAAIILHSSGSTGLPKPIVLTQRFVSDTLNMPGISGFADAGLYGTVSLPAFHMLGWMSHIAVPLSVGVVCVHWAPSNPLPVATAESALVAFKAVKVTSCMAVPSFLITWSRDEETIQYLTTLRYIAFGGGPLPQEVGDKLVAAGVKIISGVGGTEFSMLSLIKSQRPDRTPEEWVWLELTERIRKRWVKQEDGSETYELQILDSDTFVPAVHNTETPDGPAYATSDLYIQHPTKEGMWKIVGRLDDQVTLATGEKINPGPIQNIISHHPSINGVVLLGRAKSQAAILVEPIKSREFDPSDEKALAEFRNEIWPAVENSNRASAAFARIFKELILPTTPGKPLPRTPKGTIAHKAAVNLYTDEIAALYAEVDKAKGDDVTPPKTWGEPDIAEWLGENLKALLERDVDATKDLFDQGADSLTATYIRNRIIGAMHRAADTPVQTASQHIEQNVVFTHPTITSLAKHVAKLARSPQPTTADTAEEAVRQMQALVEQYSATLPSGPRLSHETVLLTGSTGALGSLLLAKMLEDDRVERVWAVNRRAKGSTIEERQQAAFEDKGLDPELLQKNLGGKLVFVEAQLHEEGLGLDKRLYHDICATTTLIIHNAWRLDFNLSISSFEPHIKGTRNLIDVALASPIQGYTRVFFTSSVATVTSWKDTSSLVPEDPISDPHYSVGSGYGEGKYVGEKLLEAATLKSGLQTTNFRVGQLSGSENGMWATTDWVPILVTSSIRLGCLPDAVGSASWLPLHRAAAGILDIGLDRSKPLEQTLHLFHPRPTPWTTIFEAISTALEPIAGKHLPLVPFSEWLAKLEEIPTSEMERVPGLKLLPFYRGIAKGDAALRAAGSSEDRESGGQARLMTSKIQRASETIGSVPPIGAGDAPRWVAYWDRKGLFNAVKHNAT